MGDDTAALRILAIELEDMVEAERYCAEQGLKGGEATHALLLDMLLHPGQGRPPMFAQACHLLAAQGYLLPLLLYHITATSHHQSESDRVACHQSD